MFPGSPVDVDVAVVDGVGRLVPPLSEAWPVRDLGAGACSLVVGVGLRDGRPDIRVRVEATEIPSEVVVKPSLSREVALSSGRRFENFVFQASVAGSVSNPTCRVVAFRVSSPDDPFVRRQDCLLFVRP